MSLSELLRHVARGLEEAKLDQLNDEQALVLRMLQSRKAYTDLQIAEWLKLIDQLQGRLQSISGVLDLRTEVQFDREGEIRFADLC